MSSQRRHGRWLVGQRELPTETTQRCGLDLSDLPAAEQAALIAARSQELQPSADALAERIIEAEKKGRRFIAKVGRRGPELCLDG